VCCGAVCCSVLQRVAVCCSVLQCVADPLEKCPAMCCRSSGKKKNCQFMGVGTVKIMVFMNLMLQCVAVSLQRVAVCCSVLQCAAV